MDMRLMRLGARAAGKCVGFRRQLRYLAEAAPCLHGHRHANLQCGRIDSDGGVKVEVELIVVVLGQRCPELEGLHYRDRSSSMSSDRLKVKMTLPLSLTPTESDFDV